MRTTLNWFVLRWFVLAIVGFLGFSYVKGCVAKKAADEARWYDCLKATLDGRHPLQKLPLISNGKRSTPYVLMEKGTITIAFEANGNYQVYAFPNSKIKIALDMITAHPWVEFNYNDYKHGGCDRLDLMFTYNVNHAILHCGTKDFPHTVRE